MDIKPENDAHHMNCCTIRIKVCPVVYYLPACPPSYLLYSNHTHTHSLSLSPPEEEEEEEALLMGNDADGCK